jgi:sirohydrochlorin ferrochelatase
MRPKIQIDLNRVEELAAQGLSQAEICVSLNISEDTLGRRKKDSADFAEALRRGKTKAATVVSSKLFEMAAAGNVAAIRWWETTRMGLSDRMKSEVSVQQTFEDLVASLASKEPKSPANTKAEKETHENISN